MALPEALPGNHEMRAAIAPPETAADATARRVRDLSLLFVSLLVLITLVSFSIYILTASCSTQEDRWWASSTLTAAFGGVLGWLIKR
jgi:hypothetical protein